LGSQKTYFRYARSEAAEYSEDFPPLNEPAPPFLDEPKSIDELVARAFKQSSKQDLSEENKKFIGRTLSFFEAARTASGKGEDWHDMRSDLMESAHKGFKQSTIQGDHREGNMIEIKLLNSVPPSGLRSMIQRSPHGGSGVCGSASEPGTAPDRRDEDADLPLLCPDPITEKFKTSGSIDPARLSSTDFSESFFRRYRIENKPEPRGRPVLVILNDGSASMGRKETKMLKLLTTAWVESTKRMELQILVGIYNYVHISPAIHGNVMTWVYHPTRPCISTARKRSRHCGNAGECAGGQSVPWRCLYDAGSAQIGKGQDDLSGPYHRWRILRIISIPKKRHGRSYRDV
jgi:hypothetical protein